MSVKYVKYGTVWMAAALSATVSLWYARNNRALVTGKDAAHVMAMADVRRQIAYLTGTNTPNNYITGWWTNSVVSTNYASTVHFSTPGGDGYTVSPTNLVFTDENWSNPQYVTFTAPAYYSSSHLFGFKRDGENQGTVTATMTGSETNGVYGGIQNHGTLEWGGTSVHVDQGTSQGFWFVLTAAPTGNPTVTTNGVPYPLVDAAHRVDSVPRLNDVYSNALLVARNMAGLDTYAHTNAGVAIYWTEDDFSDGDAVACCRTDWGSTEITGSGRTNYYWTGTATNRDAVALTTSTRWPASGVRMMRGVTGTNLPVAVELYGAADATNRASFFGGFNNWWTYHGFGTNVCAVSCEFVTNGVVRALNYQITTNNLNQARAISTNLYRTVAFVDTSAMTYTGAVEKVRVASTNITGITDGNPDKDAMFGVLKGIETVTWTNAAWAGTSFSCDYRGQYWMYHVFGYDHDDSDRAAYTIRQYRWTGCRLPYPSEYACASGYVSRVRVYAVGGAGVQPAVQRASWANYPSDHTFPAGWTNCTFSGNTPQPDSYDGNAAPPVTTMGQHGVRTPAFDWRGTAYDTYSLAMQYPVTNRLSLVCDVSHPSASPAFTLGTVDDTDVSGSDLGWEYVFFDDSTNPSTPGEYAYTWYSFVHRVDVWKFVVVVDWSWLPE